MNCRLLLGLLAFLCCLAAQAQDTNRGIVIRAEDGKGLLTFDPKTGIATYSGRLIVEYGQSVLNADIVQVDKDTGEAFATGNVILQSEGGRLWRGDKLSYNFKTKVIAGDTFRAGQPPYFVSGTNLITDPTNHTYVATNAYFTSDDNAQPNYRWHGALPHAATLRRIQRAQVLVHPSAMEGGAHVVMEAILCGTPVLASRISGNVGMLGRDYRGYFEPGDAAGLAALLQRLRDDPAMLQGLCAQCDQRSPLFEPAREQATLNNVIAQLLETSRERP